VVHNNQEVIITKGTSVTFNEDTFEKLSIKSTKPEWTSNQISFKKEKLQNILDEIQREYNCEISLNSKENEQLFTGTLPANDLKTALNIISSTYHLKISKFETNKITLEDF
jgi:ferric-dicitrate binding protein FerR (iron transport regulator)